jgi:hypothetical protein
MNTPNRHNQKFFFQHLKTSGLLSVIAAAIVTIATLVSNKDKLDVNEIMENLRKGNIAEINQKTLMYDAIMNYEDFFINMTNTPGLESLYLIGNGFTLSIDEKAAEVSLRINSVGYYDPYEPHKVYVFDMETGTWIEDYNHEQTTDVPEFIANFRRYDNVDRIEYTSVTSSLDFACTILMVVQYNDKVFRDGPNSELTIKVGTLVFTDGAVSFDRELITYDFENPNGIDGYTSIQMGGLISTDPDTINFALDVARQDVEQSCTLNFE